LIVCRALYGLKSAGAAWRALLAQVLTDLNFQPTKADPDFWIRAALCAVRFEYYKMLFVYVDNMLAVSHRVLEVIEEITSFYKAKEGSIKWPEIYLRENVAKIQMPDGREVWSTSPRDYIKNTI
jgi:hypothetical protein